MLKIGFKIGKLESAHRKLMASKPQRRRKRVLTDQGLKKIQDAIWKELNKCPNEYNFTELSEFTGSTQFKQLDCETVAKILRRQGNDINKIKCLFNAFGLALEESDYTYFIEESKAQDPEPSTFEATPVLGQLRGLPPQPRILLQRPDELNALKTLVLAETNQSRPMTRTARTIVIRGMGGIGKSVLAGMLAQDNEVRSAFRDGVLWLTLGQKPALTLRQADLAKMLGDSPPIFQDVQQGRIHLSELLAEKACLLILDDAWEFKHVEPFTALGSRCLMVVTTRNSKLVNALEAEEYPVGLLNEPQAVELLALRAGEPGENLPDEAREVARECGYLPLALAMVGSMVRGKPDRSEYVLHRLRNADLEKIKADFPGYDYPNLLRAIQVSLDDLESHIQVRYLDFAVFPEDTPIPEPTLQTFWRAEGLDRYETKDVLDELVDRSLAQRNERDCLSLHDLQHDYVRKQAGDLSTLHNRLLCAYATHCPNGWHSYPTNDGYFFEHLAYHLKESGQKDELYKLLTQSPDWMQAKSIACTGDASYATDLDLALSDFADPLEPKQLLTLIQLYVARQAVNQRVICYNDTDLKTLVWLGREAEALTYARLRPDAKGKFDGLLTVYNTLQEKGQPNPDLLNLAWQITRIIQDKPNEANRRVEALSDLMVALARSERNDEVNTLFEQAQEVLLEVREILDSKAKSLNSTKTATKSIYEMLWVAAHSKLASALFLAGQEEKAAEFFRKAEKLANTLPGLRKVGAWITLVEELAQARQFTEAQRVAQAIVPVWEELTEEIIDSTWATVTALSKLAVVLAQSGSKDKANAVLTEAREIAKSLQDDQFEDKALTELETAKSTILAQVGRFKQSEEVARKIESNEHRTQALRELAVAMAKTKQPEHKEKASLLLNEVETISRTARDEYLWNLVLASLTAALARSQHFTEAEKVLRVIEGDAEAQEAQASALIALAAALAKVGNFKKAKEIAQSIEGSVRYKRFYALKDIAIALAQAENYEASQVFAEAVEEAWRYGDLRHRVEALSTIAVAMVQAGGQYKEKASEAFAKAEEITRAIRDGLDYRPLLSKSKISREDNMSWYSIFYLLPLMSAFTHLAKAWAKVGRVDKALMFFELAGEVVQKIEEIRSPLSEYLILSEALAEVGYFDMAEIMAQMNDSILYYVKALIALEVALAEVGEKEKASAIHAEVMELVQYGRNTITSTTDLGEIGIVLGKAGYFVEAVITLGQESLDKTLSKLIEWIDAFEKVELGLSLVVLRQALRIAGWVHPGWQDIYEILPITTTS